MEMDNIRAASLAGQINTQTFQYSVQFPVATFVVNAALQLPIAIQNDSDFVVRQSTAVAWSAAGVLVPAPDVLIQLMDTASGRNWSDFPVPLLNIFGTAGLPYIWPEPIRIAGGSTIVVTAVNIGPAPMLLYLTFSGIKLFAKPGYNR